jgi:hypothetical protein
MLYNFRKYLHYCQILASLRWPSAFANRPIGQLSNCFPAFFNHKGPGEFAEVTEIFLLFQSPLIPVMKKQLNNIICLK